MASHHLRHKKHKEHKEGLIHEDKSVRHNEHENKAKKEHHKKGGSVGGEFGNKKVLEEAEEGAHGEHHIAGGASAKLGRKRGGKVEHHGHHGKHHAHGGEVGADKNPFSSAHHHSKYEE